MAFLSEAEVEATLLEQLEALGYARVPEGAMEPSAPNDERENHRQVVLQGRLERAVQRLNPKMPESARREAVQRVTQSDLPSLLEENRRLHRLMTQGVELEYLDAEFQLLSGRVALIDFEVPENNEWLAVSQLAVEGSQRRRPDVVLYLNGMPVAVIELKAPGSAEADLVGAFHQLQTYKQQIPALFHTNALLVTSDGLSARVGSLTADLERFMPWRTIDGKSVASKGSPEMSTLIEGVFEPRRFLQILRDFTVFGETGAGLVKIVAGYHQFHAVQHAVERTVKASEPSGDRRVGVIWHTQGSGKSLLMAFYAGRLVQHPAMGNPTLVVLTDRNDLDDQLFATFSMCKSLIRQTPIQVESREDLKTQLNRASGGVIFTTLQKFGEVDGPLTTRKNVVVIADEAHRSQYGLDAKVSRETGEVSYGFAKYMRDALPNASFIGFTGTPIESADVNTRAVFGDYIDIYDISRAVEDGATVPIYYESRLARIELDESETPRIDSEVEELTEEESMEDRERLKQRWSTVEALVGSQRRLELVANDLVTHFEARTTALDGKAMVVCMSRKICVKLYDEIVKLRPEWHSTDDSEGAIKIVMTGAASDPPEWQNHIGGKGRRDLLAKRARDITDPLKMVIVCDMWLTGFDAPCMHTMYIDKPMKGHGLMQAIARVNRVFRDKPAGLVVDYIGVAQNLKSALREYSANDQRSTGVDEKEAVRVMLERYGIVKDMFHGFDYLGALHGTPDARLRMMAEALNWVLEMQQQLAAQEESEEGKKKAHRRYADEVLGLSKAFALASASDAARKIREEVGFFQSIRAALSKTTPSGVRSQRDRELAIQQIVSRAVVSTEIVDILRAAGIESPDISILSDEFLLEMQHMKQKNLALEALRRLLEDDIRSRSESNVVESQAFSQRLQEAMSRYHMNALSTVEVLNELVGLAKEMRAAHARGEALGLTAEELAFYDALAAHESAREAMGDEQLRLIAHELLQSLRGEVSVDWIQREGVRARMRVTVKRLLRKYGYPPDLEDSAVKNVLRQAEALAHVWAKA